MWEQVRKIKHEFWHTFTSSGDYWLVRSSQVKIQARYGAPNGWIRELAIGGPFLQNHVLRISASGSGWDGFAMSWDGEPVLQDFPSTFQKKPLIQADLAPNAIYQNIVRKHNPKHWRSRKTLRSLEVTLPSDVELTINLGDQAGNFLDFFVSMPMQPDFQGGHCGRAQGDFNVDWAGAAVAPEESLLTGKALLLAATEAERQADATTSLAPSAPPLDKCISGGLAEERAQCETVLNKTGDATQMLLLDACAADVCVGGPEMVYRTATVGLQVYYKTAASAAGATKCKFDVRPWHHYYWDPTCYFGRLGCLADGHNVNCRYCGRGTYASIPCP